MFDQVLSNLDNITSCCDDMSDDNIVEKISEIGTNVAQIKLLLEEIEFQNTES